jgi:hypothetical protein
MMVSCATVMVMHAFTTGNLMAPHTNHNWSNGVGTRPRVGVTSSFIALLTIISPTYMKVRSLGHFVILYFQSTIWFFLFSTPSCCGHSLVVSIPLLVTFLNFHFTSIVPLAWFSLDQSSISLPCPILCCNFSTIPRERGKQKTQPQYYSFISRCNH